MEKKDINKRLDKVRDALQAFTKSTELGLFRLKAQAIAEGYKVDTEVNFETGLGKFQLQIKELYRQVGEDYHFVKYLYHLAEVQDDGGFYDVFFFHQEILDKIYTQEDAAEWRMRSHFHSMCTTHAAYQRVHIPLFVRKEYDNGFYNVDISGTDKKEDLLVSLVRWIAKDFIHYCNAKA